MGMSAFAAELRCWCCSERRLRRRRDGTRYPKGRPVKVVSGDNQTGFVGSPSGARSPWA